METRLYSIVNQYIAGIHAGIQTAHAAVDLTSYYVGRGSTNAQVLADQWAKEDKTIIVLDGGYQSNLERIYGLMQKCRCLPSAAFRETEDALNGALTAVCIVLPKYMYDPQYHIDEGPGGVRLISNTYWDSETGNTLHNYTQYEKDLIVAIKSLRLKGA